MPMGTIFWVIMLVWLAFYLLTSFGGYGAYGHYGVVVQFILFLLLGWKVFGRPVQ